MRRLAVPILLLALGAVGLVLWTWEEPSAHAAQGAVAALLRSLIWLAALWAMAVGAGIGVRAGFLRRSGHLPPKLLVDVVLALLWALGLAALAVVEFGVTPGTAFATSGVVIAVVGFAVRSLVADLFYGITMAIERPFEIGNWIQLSDGIVGRVEEMTWRAVKLVTKDNLRVVVPNTQLAAEHIVNYDQPERCWRKAMHVVLGYEVTPAQVQRILDATVRQVAESVAVGRPAEARINGYTERGVEWELRYWLPDYPSSSEINQRIQEAFLQHLRFGGIQIPRPREEVYVGALVEERDHDRKVSQDWIDQVALFAGISSDERSILQAGAAVHRLQAGTDVVRQGEPGESLFVVREGALDVLIDGVHGGGEKVGVMGPGAVFGELSLLTGAPRSASVRASTAALVHEITKADLEPLLHRNPDLAERLAEVVADRRLADAVRGDQRSERELQAERNGLIDSLLLRARTFFRLGPAPQGPRAAGPAADAGP
jgi:small-conductance mechanosensitive channel